jgi:hypothetical protein
VPACAAARSARPAQSHLAVGDGARPKLAGSRPWRREASLRRFPGLPGAWRVLGFCCGTRQLASERSLATYGAGRQHAGRAARGSVAAMVSSRFAQLSSPRPRQAWCWLLRTSYCGAGDCPPRGRLSLRGEQHARAPKHQAQRVADELRNRKAALTLIYHAAVAGGRGRSQALTARNKGARGGLPSLERARGARGGARRGARH